MSPISSNSFNWNKINDHFNDENCLFADLYADKSRGTKHVERGPNKTDSSLKYLL